MKIVADAHIPYVNDYFATCGELILKPGRAISANDVKDADMLLVRSITRVDEQLLANSRIRFVGSITAGVDHIDMKWLQAAGIDVAFASGFNAPPVADYVISIIAALQRKRMLKQESVRVALIGVGNVGRLILPRLKLLGFDVILCDPIRAESESDFISVPLEDIHDVDLISLHVPLTQHTAHPTYHFIDKHFLKRQKPNCVLINASRGSVIQSSDLLQHGMHLSWCLDVWEHEPLIDKSILTQALLATPHIAGYSVQSKMRGIDMIYRAACAKNLIAKSERETHVLPTQTLTFAGEKHHWQDVVLGIFNPVVMTAMMRSLLLPAKEYGVLFDDMRNKFTYRHEFASTIVNQLSLSNDDAKILTGLGIKVTQG